MDHITVFSWGNQINMKYTELGTENEKTLWKK